MPGHSHGRGITPEGKHMVTAAPCDATDLVNTLCKRYGEQRAPAVRRPGRSRRTTGARAGRCGGRRRLLPDRPSGVRNAPSNYLRLNVIPTLMGFDPMVQVIHQDDVVSAIEKALRPGVRGIFNLAGPQPLPLSRLSPAR